MVTEKISIEYTKQNMTGNQGMLLQKNNKTQRKTVREDRKDKKATRHTDNKMVILSSSLPIINLNINYFKYKINIF